MSIEWFELPNDNITLYGVNNDYKRLPAEFAASISDRVKEESSFAAGGRIRFATNSKNIWAKCQ